MLLIVEALLLDAEAMLLSAEGLPLHAEVMHIFIILTTTSCVNHL